MDQIGDGEGGADATAATFDKPMKRALRLLHAIAIFGRQVAGSF